MEPVKLAVVGAGLIGSKHARLVHGQPECSLVGVCDPDPGRRSVAEELEAPFYRDLTALLEEQQPEGVIVATPNGTHLAVAEVCAAKGVDLLIEKPIADTLPAARSIVEVAAASGCRILVGHHRRHNPLIREARSQVQGGALGRLIAASMMWTLLKPAEYFQVDWRCRRPQGGPLLINLIHELDILRYICGEIRQVYAQSASMARGLEVEDTLSITLSFADGALGSIIASDAAPSPWSYEISSGENPYYFHTSQNCYHFLGSEGALAFPRMELWRYGDPSRAGWQHPLSRTRREVAPADPLVLQLQHFCRVVRGREPPLVDGADGARTLAVALAVQESIDRQAPVLLADEDAFRSGFDDSAPGVRAESPDTDSCN
ncbi:MAG: Gfo/Idh/MocA family oxidoreductase [Acidobacteria bacterium]|nr:Gfo/Idh/MocA family oxidoreductase [Acidobacteriota bacterium]